MLASEAGVIEEPPANVLRKGRLQPGKLFLVDLEQGRIVDDEEVKHEVATRRPYGEWYANEVVRLADLPAPARARVVSTEPLRRLQLLFGYTHEDMKVMLQPLAQNGEEAVGSMGNDTPLAVLSDRKPLLYSYFKQLFAQVTNPPIDSIREAVVMSVRASVGSERNLLDETPEHARQLVIDNPILLDGELETAAAGRFGGLPRPHDRRHLAGRRRARRAGGRSGTRLRRGRRSSGRRGEHPRPLRPRRRRPSARRCRRCSRSRRSTITSSARARACRPGSSSSRGSRAACRASPSSSATALRP